MLGALLALGLPAPSASAAVICYTRGAGTWGGHGTYYGCKNGTNKPPTFYTGTWPARQHKMVRVTVNGQACKRLMTRTGTLSLALGAPYLWQRTGTWRNGQVIYC